jgi:hypothetical protein
LNIKNTPPNFDLSVRAIDGKVIFKIADATQIDVSHFPAGTYFMKIQSSNFLFHELFQIVK